MNLAHAAHLFSNLFFLSFVAGIPAYGFLKKIAVYDTFIDGAKHGFDVVLRLLPYLVAMIVAIGMFRASGGFDLLAKALRPLLVLLGIPVEVFPLAVVRPFSGSASVAMLSDVIQTQGADSIFSQMAATMFGSTETTFYVLAVYFGVVAVQRTRHAVWAGLFADLIGIVSAVWICRWFFA